jgi:outer membrane lipase/esterase
MAMAASTAVSNCAANPIWVQVVAYSFGYGFQQCRGTQALNQLGRTWAQPGATVSAANGADTIAGQIQDFRDAGGVFNDKDLVLLMAGMHDVLARYRQYNSADADNSRNTLAGLAEQDGLALGQLVVQMTNEGAKVIVAVVPDQGLSPYADAEETARPSEGRRATLRALTTAFNKGLQDKMQEVRGGGRSAGLVLSDALHADFYASNNPYGFTDPPPALTPTCIPVTAPGAFPALPPAPVTTCDDASGHVKVGNYLWADYLRYSPIGHSVLGSAASSRAHDNPF